MEGVLYLAAGEKYRKEMLDSLSSLRNHVPDIHVTAITDKKVESDLIDENQIFTEFNYDMGDSIIRPNFLPYKRTLFLDVDTYVCGDISEVFRILNRFDIAAAHNPERATDWFEAKTAYSAHEVPKCFPQYNTGVVLLKDAPEVRKCLEDWLQIYKNRTSEGHKFNQPAFREALYNSDARIATLPPEYNVRINRPGYLNGPAMILHGRSKNMNKIENRLNASFKSRTFSLNRWPIKVDVYRKPLHYKVAESIQKNGLLYTMKRAPVRMIEEAVSLIHGSKRSTD